MIVAGKAPPTESELSDVAADGYDAAELYIEPPHLDDLDETRRVFREAAVDIVSVHTPHVSLSDTDYFQRANDLADALDAHLVVHSGHLDISLLDGLRNDVHLTADHGFENQPGYSQYYIENRLLYRDHNLILDTAHLYIGEDDYETAFETLIDDHAESIPIVHCCDSTVLNDGLPFGDGDMPMRHTIKKLKQDYDGIVDLEVPRDAQSDALDRFSAVSQP